METKKNTRLLSLDTLRGFDMLVSHLRDVNKTG